MKLVTKMMENLKQAQHLLFTVDGVYRPTTVQEMAEIKRLLDEAAKNLEDGDDRRAHENLTTHYERLANKSWNISGTAIGAGIILTILMFLGLKMGEEGPFGEGSALGLFIYFLIGTIVYAVSAYYPAFMAKNQEKVDDFMPFGDEDPDTITKHDLNRAAAKAAGQDTSISDGFEIGKVLSKAMFGIIIAFGLPFIAAYNFLRFWVLKK
jgi:hypothetical protein